MSSNLFAISSRVILISGGGTGIGSFATKGLAEHRAARVYITGRRAENLEACAKSAPGTIIPIVGDVSCREGCKKIVEEFVEKEKVVGVEGGDISLDSLSNNAGIGIFEGVWD